MVHLVKPPWLWLAVLNALITGHHIGIGARPNVHGILPRALLVLCVSVILPCVQLVLSLYPARHVVTHHWFGNLLWPIQCLVAVMCQPPCWGCRSYVGSMPFMAGQPLIGQWPRHAQAFPVPHCGLWRVVATWARGLVHGLVSLPGRGDVCAPGTLSSVSLSPHGLPCSACFLGAVWWRNGYGKLLAWSRVGTGALLQHSPAVAPPSPVGCHAPVLG